MLASFRHCAPAPLQRQVHFCKGAQISSSFPKVKIPQVLFRRSFKGVSSVLRAGEMLTSKKGLGSMPGLSGLPLDMAACSCVWPAGGPAASPCTMEYFVICQHHPRSNKSMVDRLAYTYEHVLPYSNHCSVSGTWVILSQTPSCCSKVEKAAHLFSSAASFLQPSLCLLLLPRCAAHVPIAVSLRQCGRAAILPAALAASNDI